MDSKSITTCLREVLLVYGHMKKNSFAIHELADFQKVYFLIHSNILNLVGERAEVLNPTEPYRQRT